MIGLSLIQEIRAERPATPNVIADVLRVLVLRGHFAAGQPLRQDEIAGYFGVSRIPVREALRQLSAEGLAELRDNRGAIVAPLRADEAEEILDIRFTLEIKAAGLAMSQWTEATFAKLCDNLAEAESCESVDRWSDLNRSFHEMLYSPCGRPRLMTMIASLNTNVERYIRLLVSQSDYRLQAQREHQAILASAQVGNLPSLSALIEQHATQTAVQLHRFLSVFDRVPGTRRRRYLQH